MNARNPIATLSRTLGLAGILALAAISAPAQKPDTSGGAAVSANNKLQIINEEGKVIFTVQLPSPPSVKVSPDGATVIVSDQNGTRFYDRKGNQKGSQFDKNGTRQEVVLKGDRAIVIDDDKVRISDLKGKKQGQDIPKRGNKRQKVIVDKNGRIIVVDEKGVRLFDKKGKPVGDTVDTNGFPDVFTNGKRTIIRDADGVIILGADGKVKTPKFTPQQVGQWQIIDDDRYVVLSDNAVQVYDQAGLTRGVEFRKTGTAKQKVIVCGGRVVIVDDDRVRILNRDGQQLTGVNTTGPRAEVKTTEDRIIITDNQSTRVFGKVDARLIVGAAVTDGQRQYVATESSAIVVTDGDQTRIYHSDGSLQGDPIMRSGWDTQLVYSNGDRLGVVDTDKVRLYDLGGNQVGQDIAYTPDLEMGLQMFDSAFTISDFNQVRIFDRDGVQQGGAINVSDGLQHIQMAGDQILVTHDNFLRIFLPNGTQVGQTQAVGFEPEVFPIAFYGGGFTSIGLECGEAKQYALGNAAPGEQLTYELGNAPAGTLAQLNLGLSKDSYAGFTLPFDLEGFGAPGCSVYNDVVGGVSLLVSDEGFAQVDIPVPDDPNLVGFTFYTQWMMLAPGANALGILLSDGVETRIGSAF